MGVESLKCSEMGSEVTQPQHATASCMSTSICSRVCMCMSVGRRKANKHKERTGRRRREERERESKVKREKGNSGVEQIKKARADASFSLTQAAPICLS